MIKLEKVGNEFNPDIRISDGINSFMIARNNLPDLCWYPEINYFKNKDDVIFKIDKNEGKIYLLFLRLYLDVINGNIFPYEDDVFRDKSPQEVERLKKEKDERDTEYRRRGRDSGLIQDDIIIMHSEDYDEYDCASILEIHKNDNEITVIFKKNKINFELGNTKIPTYNVRITESMGRYWPFNVIFSNFRRKLQNLVINSNTIDSVEETEFQKTLIKEGLPVVINNI
jgi:hypothetical protein